MVGHRGSATLQLITVMPFMLLILLGGLDLGRVVLAKVALASAVHVGVAQGARVIQLKKPESPDWLSAPVWAFNDVAKTIDFDNGVATINLIIAAMEKAASDDITNAKLNAALNFDNKTKVFCRCLKTDATTGKDSYTSLDPLACDHNDIKTCEKSTSFAKAVRQIFVGMQPKLTVTTVFYWPFVSRQIDLSVAAIMQGDEFP